MSKMGQWFFELENAHYEGECKDTCQFCREEENCNEPITKGCRNE